MRRKGQAPFGKRGLGGKMGAKANGKMNKRYGMTTIDAENEAEADGDFLYNSMRQVVSEGMNHITKTLMQTGGYNEGDGYVQSDAAGDLVNSSGELQTRGQENIPLRPLVISNISNNNNYSMNVAQNMPSDG